MNWKKFLLVLVLGTFALVFFTVAAVGCAATVAVSAAAAAIDESGVVQAFEEVAAGAERLQVDLDENSLTVTNLDSGESRVVMAESAGRVDANMPEITITESGDGAGQIILADPDGGRGRLELNMPGIIVSESDDGGSRVIIAGPDSADGRFELALPGITVSENQSGQSQVIITDESDLDGQFELTLPGITISEGQDGEGQIILTDPDNGQSRVIIPADSRDNAERFEDAPRAPRVVWDGDHYGPELGLRLVGEIFSGLFTLTALVLIAAGAFLLLRNRRQAQTKAGDIDKTA